jgi:hypothetical protein
MKIEVVSSDQMTLLQWCMNMNKGFCSFPISQKINRLSLGFALTQFFVCFFLFVVSNILKAVLINKIDFCILIFVCEECFFFTMSDNVEPEERRPAPIVLEVSSTESKPPTSDAVLAEADAETQRLEMEKLKTRAERFGVVDLAEPIPGVTVPLQRKFRKPREDLAFPLGFDVFAEDELVKKELRMHRFGSQKPVVAHAPEEAKAANVEEEEWKGDSAKKESRASRFGVVKKRELEGEDQQQEVVVSKKKPTPKKRQWRLARKDPGDAPQRADTLYFHGCDRLKSNDVFGLFREYGPSTLEWINGNIFLFFFSHLALFSNFLRFFLQRLVCRRFQCEESFAEFGNSRRRARESVVRVC